ncbi:MAG: TrmH family RNA methyltransferase [Bacteroidota bacterium]
MNITAITSTQNVRIKEIGSLEKARERKEHGVFVIEGVREITLAATAGYRIQTLVVCEDLFPEWKGHPAAAIAGSILTVTHEVFSRLAVREDSGGMIAVAAMKPHTLAQLRPGPAPLLLVLESVEKPGNLGAILRTADAARVDAVIVCDPQTDLYNPNAIRSGIGCLFTVPVAVATSAEAITWLKQNNIRIWATHLEGAVPYHTVDYLQPSAIVMGTEATGLSTQWVAAANAAIIIPMRGKIDSMNVSTAAAVVVFEAMRQRGF